MSRSNWVYIEDAHVKRRTDKAVLVAWESRDGPREEWLPLSQLADPDDYEEGDGPLTIAVTEWIAQQKDIDTDYVS